MRRALMTLSVLSLLALVLVPTGVAQGTVPPVIASDNIDLLFTMPEAQGAISTAFDPARPLMYVNTLHGISVYDVSNPAMPLIKGVLPMPHFENESMAIGSRSDKTFVLVGVDIFALTPTDTGDPAFISGGSAQHLIVVDVTDPMLPKIISQLDTGSSTHTVQCLNTECTYAYTSGAYNNKTFHLIDLSNPSQPKQVGPLTNFAGGGPVSIGGHQWDKDDAGVMWASSGGGLAAYDVTDPADPRILQSTNAKGAQGPYNNFVIHNSYRPNGDDYVQVLDEATGRLSHPGSPETASVFNGDVALVTEEDYDNPVCGGDAGEGTFSTWYIPYMQNDQFMAKHSAPNGHNGDMVPLDNWNSEILNTGTRTPAGALCSAHYFTFHDAGFVAQGWYQQGTRILDVRNPRDIKQVGYFFATASETWHAYWVPERDAQGRVTGRDTNIVYTNDVARGIDVLRVTLPTTSPGQTIDLTAPILPAWLTGSFSASKPSSRLGYLCRLAGSFVVA